MEAKNLRIGNYLRYDDKIIFVSEITKTGIGMYDGYGFDKSTPFDMCRPIKLTKKWLKKFNFEINEKDNEYQFNGGFTEFTLYESDSANFFGCYEIKVDGFLLIEYVHQIQNLFFAITGRELELKQDISA